MKKFLTKFGLSLTSIFLSFFSFSGKAKGVNTWGGAYPPPNAVPTDIQNGILNLTTYVFEFFIILAFLPVLKFLHLKFIKRQKIGDFLKVVLRIIGIIFLWLSVLLIYIRFVPEWFDNFFSILLISFFVLVVVLLYIFSTYIYGIYKNSKSNSKIKSEQNNLNNSDENKKEDK